MSIGSLLLGATVLILVGLFLARPFLLSNARYGRRKGLRQELLAQKEAILAQIQVIEFDYETGTLPEQEYKQQRRQLVAEAAEILERLDNVPGTAETTSTGGVDNEIEAAVARLRQRQPHPAAAPAPQKAAPPAPIPAAAEKPVLVNGQVKFCAQCGQAVEEGDKFCAYCGHKIIQPQPT
jgi:hypothetical protein